jgi:ABC-type lipopolysaccharide export system ATPase subunit
VIELGKIVHHGKSSELLNSEEIRKSYLGEA